MIVIFGGSNIIQKLPIIKWLILLFLEKRGLLKKGAFSDEKEINSHIQYIETENTKLDKISRMRELENWLNYLNLE